MPDIHIHRAHSLGLPKARKLALKWVDEAKEKYGLECTIVQGDTHDTVEFTRPGVEGNLLVEADQITLDAKLGFLLGALGKQIEAEIAANIDSLLQRQGAAPAVRKR
jgi:putative polyhydroxyalkanoate system protein